MKRRPTPAAQPLLGKRARTRQRLIETAADLIREKGFPNVSMEQVAAEAGVSRGSIYGNFRDRNDLFLAVALYRMPRVVPAPAPGASLREQLRAMGQAVARQAIEHRKDTVYWAAYMLHALSDDDLLRRADAQGREMRREVARAWAEALPPGALSMPIETFVKVVSTLTSSLIMAHSMSPQEYDEPVIVAAFEALAGCGGPAVPFTRAPVRTARRAAQERR